MTRKEAQIKRWRALSEPPAVFMSEFPEYPRAVLALLYHRGITTHKDLDEFFAGEYATHVHDPFLFLDMKKAVERIVRAIEHKEKIVVFGDYDADGVSGSVILHTTITALKGNVEVYIPDRFHEGYGLSKQALSKIIKEGAKLIITVDCGTTNNEEIAFAKEHGVDVIIADHHLVPQDPPPAYAMINPKRDGEPYPFKYLCATGVTFKIACALLLTDRARTVGIPEGFDKWLLDVAAIGTVADMVPLVGENRTLVKYGLIVLTKTKRIGLQMLLDAPSSRMRELRKGNLADTITTETIAFSLAPRINATSRMDHATISLNLLLADDRIVAERLTEKVEELNNERRRLVDRILKDAHVMVEEEIAQSGGVPNILFLGKEDWPVGVVGLVSGRLTEQYGRPSFIWGRVNNYYKGSCRGFGDFHVVEAMRFCDTKQEGLLIGYGGHPVAGGFSLNPERIDDFKQHMLAFGNETLAKENLQPIIKIDTEVSPDDISWELFDWLLRFEPFGEGNKRPVFLLKNVEVVSAKGVGKKEDHLKIKLKAQLADGRTKFYDGIGFGLSAHGLAHCGAGEKVDVVFELDANEWNGTRELQLKLKDIRAHHG